MAKWYEKVDNDASNIISSRVRLARNWDEYKFPSKLDDEEATVMISRLHEKLSDLGERSGRSFEFESLTTMPEIDRIALRERRLLNKTLVEKTTPGALLLSDDEEVSIILNGDDHLRMQIIKPGFQLNACYSEADMLDDYVNEKIYYAFSPKYGYLTSYPTNVGTGLKASVLVHLPSLNASQKFQDLLAGMSRFGVGVRGLYGRGVTNVGDIYEVYNQKTLGISEREILDIVSYVAHQLAGQETRIRRQTLEEHRLAREDEAYKSYGVLKYSRKLSVKEALSYLSHVRAGIEDGLLKPAAPVSIYRLMTESQPANLQKMYQKPLGQEELEKARADYIRENLPDLQES